MPIILEIDGRSTVKRLADDFQDQTGGVLKVYTDPNAHRLANEQDRLARVRVFNVPTTVGRLQLRSDITVGSFCERVSEEYGLVVRIFRPDGRVMVPEDVPLSRFGDIRYQASRKEMEYLALCIAEELENEDCESAANELERKGRDIRDKRERLDVENSVNLLDRIIDCLRKRDLNPIVDFFEKYPITASIGMIGSIYIGNPLGLTASTINLLCKIYRLLQRYKSK